MKIQHKRSAALDGSVAKEPTAAQTDLGELCVNFNTADPALFIRDNADNIRRVGGDLSLYQKIEDTPPPVFVCQPDEINAQSPPAERLEGTLWWNTEEGVLYVWFEDGDSEQWVIAVPQTDVDVPPGTVIGETPPSDPEVGQLWWNSSDDSGRLYVYYEDANSQQWVEASPQVDSLTEEQSDNRYLSKVSDDTAEGAITFKELTTHEAGISVTGGGIDGNTSNIFKAVSSSSQVNPFIISTNDNVGVSITSPGAVNVYGTTYRQTSGNPAYRFQIGTGGFHPTSTNQTACFVKSDFTTNQPTAGGAYSHFVVSSQAGGTHQGELNGFYCGSISQGVSNTAGTKVIGFKSDIDNDGAKPNIEAYNFYAAGDAPNYFAGSVYISGSTSTQFLSGNGGLKLNTGSNQEANSRLEIKGTWREANSNNLAISFTSETSSTDTTPKLRGAIRIWNDKISIAGLDSSPFIVDEGADARKVTSTEAITNASAVVQQLQPVKINGTRHGFTASALEPLFAEAVSGTANETEAIGTLADYDGTVLETEVTEPSDLTYTEDVEVDGVTTATVRTRTWTPSGTRPVYQGVDQTKLIPLLTKALQEALDRIEQLESNTLQPLYASLADLPSASDHHGKVAHVHSEGALYFAHAGNWVKLQNA